MADEFIEGWDVRQILGEGTFAEVKLLLNRTTGEACAMKEIDFTACGSSEVARETVMKEICVHKLLKHDNIVKCYGSRQDADRQFIFLEYCAGGELFDKIGIFHLFPSLIRVTTSINWRYRTGGGDAGAPGQPLLPPVAGRGGKTFLRTANNPPAAIETSPHSGVPPLSRRRPPRHQTREHPAD